MKQPLLKNLTGKEVAAMVIQKYCDSMALRTPAFTNIDIDTAEAALEKNNPKEHYLFRMAIWESTHMAHFDTASSAMLREASLRLTIVIGALSRYITASEIESIRYLFPEELEKHQIWKALGQAGCPGVKGAAKLQTTLEGIKESLRQYFAFKAILEAYSHKTGVNCIESYGQREEDIKESISVYNALRDIKAYEQNHDMPEEERVFPKSLDLPEINLQTLCVTKEKQRELEEYLAGISTKEWFEKAAEYIGL